MYERFSPRMRLAMKHAHRRSVKRDLIHTGDILSGMVEVGGHRQLNDLKSITGADIERAQECSISISKELESRRKGISGAVARAIEFALQTAASRKSKLVTTKDVWAGILSTRPNIATIISESISADRSL